MKYYFIVAGLLLAFLFSTNSKADLNAGLEALENGEFDITLPLLMQHSEDVNAQVGLAKYYLDTDLDQAEEWIEKAVQQQPDNAEVQYILGAVRGYQAQDAIFSALSYAKKSKKAFERAVQLSPENLVYAQGLLSFHLSAPSIAGGDIDEAHKLAQKIAILDTTAGVIAKMKVAIAREDTDSIDTILATGLQANPNNTELAFDAGMFFQDEEQWDKAFTYLEKAAYADNADDEITRYRAMYQIGRTAVFSELRIQQGIDALSNYIESAPQHSDLTEKPWAEFRLAMLYDQNGMNDEARAIFTRLAKSDIKRLRKEAKRKL